MSKNIFISHVHEDTKWLNKIEKWANDGRLGDVKIRKEPQEDLRPEGKSVIKDKIKKIIEQCSIVLVLIGHDTHNHEWIKLEVELANSLQKKLICVRIPETKGAKPEILKKFDDVVFNPVPLKKVLDKL